MIINQILGECGLALKETNIGKIKKLLKPYAKLLEKKEAVLDKNTVATLMNYTLSACDDITIDDTLKFSEAFEMPERIAIIYKKMNVFNYAFSYTKKGSAEGYYTINFFAVADSVLADEFKKITMKERKIVETMYPEIQMISIFDQKKAMKKAEDIVIKEIRKSFENFNEKSSSKRMMKKLGQEYESFLEKNGIV